MIKTVTQANGLSRKSARHSHESWVAGQRLSVVAEAFAAALALLGQRREGIDENQKIPLFRILPGQDETGLQNALY